MPTIGRIAPALALALACATTPPPPAPDDCTPKARPPEVKALLESLDTAEGEPFEAAERRRESAWEQAKALDLSRVWNALASGAAAAHVGREAEAAAGFDRVLALCPDLAPVVDDLRATACTAAARRAHLRYESGDRAGAVAHWELAERLDPRWPDASVNLAVVAAANGDHLRAVEKYTRAGVAAERLRGLSAHDAVLVAPVRLAVLRGLLAAAAKLLEAGESEPARAAFATLLGWHPAHRDATHGHMLALLNLRNWEEASAAATAGIALAPLDYETRIALFTARRALYDALLTTHREAAATPEATALLEQTVTLLTDARMLPVRVDAIELTTEPELARLKGRLTGGSRPAGQPVELEFTIAGLDGALGTRTLTMPAPAAGRTEPFELELPVSEPAVTWRYRLLPESPNPK